jgi:MGT family glycosyltransferase
VFKNLPFISRLIYVSMGTVFNNNVFVYDTIIEAFDRLSQQDESTYKQLRVVMSVGEANIKSYEDRIVSEDYRIPENVQLFASVPQLELLPKATLFVTHAGMNSTSEAIENAVPLICVPIQADQPAVARRVCDELRLGVRLDPLKMTADDVVKAVLEVINNNEYKDNISDLSKVSKRYNGAVTAASLVVKYLGQRALTN